MYIIIINATIVYVLNRQSLCFFMLGLLIFMWFYVVFMFLIRKSSQHMFVFLFPFPFVLFFTPYLAALACKCKNAKCFCLGLIQVWWLLFFWFVVVLFGVGFFPE